MKAEPMVLAVALLAFPATFGLFLTMKDSAVWELWFAITVLASFALAIFLFL